MRGWIQKIPLKCRRIKSDGAVTLMQTGYPSIRIRPELRAEHVIAAPRMTPALTLYFDEKYDLGTTPIPRSFRRVSMFRCLYILVRSDAAVLEVPEPLWLRFAAKNLMLLAVWKISGLVRLRRRVSVTYAIENNDLGRLLWPSGKSYPLIEKCARVGAGALIRLTLDRIAFGSAASRDLYLSFTGVHGVPHNLIEELPGRQDAASFAGYPAKSRARAIFLGVLDDRKGVLELMKAWPAVERAVPDAVVTVVGNGKHAEAVSSWCSELPGSRIFAGFVQNKDVLPLLAESDVVVAPSRRAGRWREQIGLPIIEGLSVGLTVVTTDETGLADWLRERGHVVIPESSVQCDLAAELISALRSPLHREDVLAALPDLPGRIVADAWLHAVSVPKFRKDCLDEI
jgi:glycosyltransferase involved in cell wall biosynthesis